MVRTIHSLETRRLASSKPKCDDCKRWRALYKGLLERNKKEEELSSIMLRAFIKLVESKKTLIIDGGTK